MRKALKYVVDFSVDRLVEKLTELDFYLHGRKRNPRIEFQKKNDQDFLDALLEVVRWVSDELEESFQETQG